MTLRKAEKITGCSVHVITADGIHFAEASLGERPVALAQGAKLKEVLKELVERVYKRNSELAAEMSEFRCEGCGKLCPTQSHHKVHRSKGRRNDKVENISRLCPACHERKHQ